MIPAPIIRAAIAGGLTVEKIAKLTGDDPARITGRLRKGRTETPESRAVSEAMAEAYRNGATQPQIANEAGMTQAAVAQRLRKLGTTRHDRGKNAL